MENDELVVVFTSTKEIEFPLNEKQLRQVFTLYNPYGYSVNFKVLCTAPNSYKVAESTGQLLAKCCKDLVVRCIAKLPAGNVDKLRIEIRKSRDLSKQLHGFQDILLKTVAEKTSIQPAESRSNFYGMTESTSIQRNEEHRRGNARQIEGKNTGIFQDNTVLAFIITAVICAIALALPTTGEPNAGESMVPLYLHLSLPQKLAASYILGIVSVLILRPL